MSSSNSPSVADILAGLGITTLAGEIVLGGVRGLSTTVGLAAPIQTLMVIDFGATSQTTATATLVAGMNPLTMASSGVQGSVTRSADGKTLTLSGTLSQVNADLNLLSYTSASAGNDTVTFTVTDGAGNTKSASFGVSVLPSATNSGLPSTGPNVQQTSTGQTATLSGSQQIYVASDKTDSVTASTSSTVQGGGAGSKLTLVQDGGSYDLTNKAGSTTLVANSAPGTITGGAAGSTLVAFLQDQPTVYYGESGNDELIGGSGGMTVNGGQAGSLTVFGGTGTLAFNGGHGDHETVVGGAGAETIHAASSGGDYFGGSGGSQMFANGAGTFLIGAVNGDVLTTSTLGGDGMVAGAGNETLNGGGSRYQNVVFGGSGTDMVMLGSGQDTYVGGSGAATIQLGHGSADLFVATGGAQSFSFDGVHSGGGHDYIGGFRVGTDHLLLSGGVSVAAFSSGGGATALLLSDGSQITLAGVTAASQGSLLG